jgi:hypothetical protein
MTGYSCFNAGRDGQSIFYHTSIFKLMLKRHTPKMILLEYDGDFNYDKKHYDRISSLLPYYEENQDLENVIKLKSRFENYKCLSKIYPYNSKFLSIVKGNLTASSKLNSENNYNGFRPLNSTVKDTESHLTQKKDNFHSVDLNKKIFFEEFIKLAQSYDIKIKVVYSPILFKYFKHEDSLKIAKSICQEYGVEFIDFSEDSIFKSKNSFFSDRTHLSSKGANLFTEKIGLKLCDNKTSER